MSVWGYRYRLKWIYGRDVSSGINARFCAHCAHSPGIDSHSWLFWFHWVQCAWIFSNYFDRVWCAWIFLDSPDMSFLVYGLGLNLPCLLILFLDSTWSCRACFHFCFLFSWIPCLFPFLISLAWIPCPFVYFIVLSRFVGPWLLLQGTWRWMFVLFKFK